MIGIKQIILSSIGGASFTILLNSFIKYYEKIQDLKKKKSTLVKFIDDIIINYLKINIEQYDSILNDLNDDKKLFSTRKVTYSPMLNKGIFDFFSKEDLLKIFSYCKEVSLVDVYHYFYEIEFNQKNSAIEIFKDFKLEISKHFDIKKTIGENFLKHIENCSFYENKKMDLKRDLEIQKEHSKTLIQNFSLVREELNNIEELSNE